jgi:hypothetical protein
MSGLIDSNLVDVFGINMRAGKQRPRLVPYERDGVDGVGAFELPAVPREVSGPTHTDFATYALAAAEATAYEALITPTKVSVQDQFGELYMVTVVDVEPSISETLTGYRLTAFWRLLPE